MSKTVVEILKEARELISVPERWTKMAYARDAVGNAVNWNDPTAYCWCSLGALHRAAENRALYHLAREFLRSSTPKTIADFNDETDHPTVLKAFDLAISKAEARQ